MKLSKKLIAKSTQKQQSVSAIKPRANKVHIKLVSDKERDCYRIPTYGYILP